MGGTERSGGGGRSRAQDGLPALDEARANALLSELAAAQRAAREARARVEAELAEPLDAYAQALIRRLFRDEAEAALDGAGEATAGALRRMEGLVAWDGRNPRGYVFGQVWRACHDLLRKRRRRAGSGVDPDDTPAPEPATERAAPELAAALDRLEASDRDTARLVRLRSVGLEYRTLHDLAALGVPYAEVRALVERRGPDAVAVLNAASRAAATSPERELFARRGRERYAAGIRALARLVRRKAGPAEDAASARQEPAARGNGTARGAG